MAKKSKVLVKIATGRRRGCIEPMAKTEAEKAEKDGEVEILKGEEK